MRNPVDPSLEQLAAWLTAVASSSEAHHPDATVVELLGKIQSSCERAAVSGASDEQRQRLTQVQAATQTWQQVWPRLGAQRDFRLAVAREARIWSKRLVAPSAGARS